MNVAVCLDDRNGMLFNRRRQSRDKVMIEDILKECKGRTLWISNFSAKLFPDLSQHSIRLSENPLAEAQAEDFCFIENLPLKPHEANIRRLIVYRWNRQYPADTYLDLDLQKYWKLELQLEFAGHSHEKITKEFYSR